MESSHTVSRCCYVYWMKSSENCIESSSLFEEILYWENFRHLNDFSSSHSASYELVVNWRSPTNACQSAVTRQDRWTFFAKNTRRHIALACCFFPVPPPGSRNDIYTFYIFSTNNLKLYHKWLELGIKELTKKIYKNCQLNKDVFFPFWFRFRAYKLSRGCSVANAHHLSHSQRAKKNIINIFRMRLKLNFQRLTVSDGRKSWRRTVRQAINCLVISLFRLDLHVQILHTR